MATSPVQICNSALVKIGAARIGSLEDDSKAAKLCKEQYDKLRKKLLRSHPWNFAIRRVALANSGHTPLYDFNYEFTLPMDVLRVLETDLLEGSDWVIENNQDSDKVLLSYSDSVKIKYIKDVTDPTFFPPDFEEALALLIASDIAYAMTGSRALAETLFGAYKFEVGEARSFDAQEGSRQEVEANGWIDVRS